ncbi:hypothetical protein DCAR_0519578 [Daucus carota subsp. sativus]|uniref:Uncharacterized protein n=1 Tax=Daucus carota subsp. sativus TaxID=79200 RepID=A0A164Y2B6_DAUCS|nr:hypothetical protein DCAR_0519578 [Daucus carota subsp. sativus]
MAKLGKRIRATRNSNQIGGPAKLKSQSTETTTKAAEEVYKYWFLLENEMVGAIRKGNSSLIPVAINRINFLKQAISIELLNEGLAGDEEALWAIYRTLHNNGWWVRAMNLPHTNPQMYTKQEANSETHLLNFIWPNDRLVHPNTQLKVREGDQEGIRMAFNQIHYGSMLKPLPENMPQQKSGNQMNIPWNDQLNITHQFIKGYANLIEPSVLAAALQGDDKALSMALGQIHHHTMPDDHATVDHRNQSTTPYKEALLH